MARGVSNKTRMMEEEALALLKSRNTLTTSMLADHFDVPAWLMQRSLDRMEKENYVEMTEKTIHGGWYVLAGKGHFLPTVPTLIKTEKPGLIVRSVTAVPIEDKDDEPDFGDYDLAVESDD
jgi:hypothetical protein